MAGGFDIGALFRKLGGDKSADVLPGRDNVKVNRNILANGGLASAFSSTDANAVGGSKYQAPSGLTVDGLTDTIYGTDTINGNGIDYAAQAAAGAAAEKRAIMDASIRGIQQNIDSLGIRKQNTINGTQTRFDTILKQYADQEAQNAAKFGKETEANEGTYSRNQSLATQAAATGRQGLMATLGSIGAMGPTAMNLANRAVARSANSDIGDASRTFESNATALTDSFAKTKQEEANRRNEAAAARDAEFQSAEYDYTEALQKAYSDMASTYAQGGNAARASQLTDQAGGLYGQLAARTKPVVAPYQSRDIGLDTSSLQSYLAGQKQNSVGVRGGNADAMNSPIYAMSRRKEELV